MKSIFNLVGTLALAASLATAGFGQLAVPPPGASLPLRASAELDQMLGPIALYPDPLVAQILPAATLPSEIVMADRYLSAGGDPNLIDQQPWDPSIKALARYPSVLSWMDQNLAWTTELGQAFLAQPQEVMDAIQRLRAQAIALGNLQSTPQETVVNDNGIIEILPPDPQVIYVPVYQPEQVYYQRCYGPPFISFGLGFRIGAWLNHDFDWHHHNLIVWRHDQPRPVDWWSHRPSDRHNFDTSHGAVWQPHNHPSLSFRTVDRGWENRPVHTMPGPVEHHEVAPPVVHRPEPVRSPELVRRAEPARRPEPVHQSEPTHRAEPAPVRHAAEAPPSRPASGALLGIQSSHETHQFSSRGQESRQGTPSPAPAPSHASSHTESPSHSSGSSHSDSSGHSGGAGKR